MSFAKRPTAGSDPLRTFADLAYERKREEPTLQVRQGTIDDLDDLVPLFDGYRTFYGQQPDEALARAFLLDRLRHFQSIIFIAFSDGQAIGFAQLFPSFSSARAARTFILNDLFVAPEARSKGAGKALLAAAADYGKAAGAVRLTLSTAHDNLAAQSLYEAMGWSREATFVSYNLPLLRRSPRHPKHHS